MKSTKWAGKFKDYRNELSFCWDSGMTVRDRMRLSFTTLQFHAANALKSRPRNEDAAKRYRLRLQSDMVELSLRSRSGDVFIFHEVFNWSVYSIPKSLCTHAEWIVDLGANIGLASMYLNQFFPSAKYVCVEPDQDNLRLLKRNLAFLGERVTFLEGAVSDEPGTAHFTRGQTWGGRLGGENGETVRVTKYTVDQILALANFPRIDILKIDIEGEERKVFHNNNGWLKKVALIIMELHGDYTIDNLKSDLAPKGFEILPPDSIHGNRMIMAFRRDGVAV